MDRDKVRIIKTCKEVIWRFACEKLNDARREIFDITADDRVMISCGVGGEKDQVTFCAIPEDDTGRAVEKNIDWGCVFDSIPYTTDSFEDYVDNGLRYREYAISELLELSREYDAPEMKLRVKHYSELTRDELFDIYKLRAEVFVVEQNCAYQDIDDADRIAYHVWLEDGNGIAAYARVLPPDVVTGETVIGRVIAKRRRCGLGKRIVEACVCVAKERLGADTVYIRAQTQAQGFYEKCGFSAISDEFIEDGIPHVKMIRKLKE